jgi:prepilin-type N-terminal cleavage/methylation domain-containing protein
MSRTERKEIFQSVMDNKPRMTSLLNVHSLFPRRTAFSILELLVVIAIMAILAAMTMAIGPGLLRSSAMSSSLSSVASAVSLARSEAIRSRRETVFVLAPTSSPLDDKAYRAYAILQADAINSTNYKYIRRWQKLPQGVLFEPDKTTNLYPNSFPYPSDAATNKPSMQGIFFVPDGSIDDDKHSDPAKKPRIALRTGVRMTTDSSPEWQGTYTNESGYLTNDIVVQRLTGKVLVERLQAK